MSVKNTIEPQLAPAGLLPLAGPIELNAFQLLMRDWTQLGPYNAGQALCVADVPDPSRWQTAVQDVMSALRLGRPQVEGSRAFFYPVEVIHVSVITDATLESLAGQQMNLPFSENDFPIRFFIITAPDRHWLLVIYNHWIADSFAMRCVMRNIFDRYRDPGAIPAPLTLAAPGFHSLFGRYLGRFPLLSRIRMSSANSLRHLQAYRLNIADPLDFHSVVSLHQLPDGLVDNLRHQAKNLHCTVNDLFLTALAWACGRLTAADRYRPRRRHSRKKIALGTIVDIRPSASRPLHDVFGLYLSCCTMLVARPETRQLHELAQSIGSHSRWIKQTDQAVRRFGTLKTAHIWYHLLGDPLHQAGFFQKASPTIAGISNVNLTGDWMDQNQADSAHGPQVLDYIRISPTGPLLPMVFTLTTIRRRLSLSVTYRTTALKQEAMDTVIADFRTALTELAQ